jgi:hypothetical protein
MVSLLYDVSDASVAKIARIAQPIAWARPDQPRSNGVCGAIGRSDMG